MEVEGSSDVLCRTMDTGWRVQRLLWERLFVGVGRFKTPRLFSSWREAHRVDLVKAGSSSQQEREGANTRILAMISGSGMWIVELERCPIVQSHQIFVVIV